MKRMLKTCLCTLLCLSILTGCDMPWTVQDNVSKNKKQLKIGVSIYDGYDTYVSDMTVAMSEWAKEKERETGTAILLDIVSAGGSQLTQNDQIARFIDKGYDAVCVNLVDRTDATVIIDKAKSADTPVVFFNREPVAEDLNRWSKLYYVGANAEQSGVLQAQLVINALCESDRFRRIDRNGDGVIQYVILEGEIGHQDALIRTQVSIETIQQAGFSIEKIGDEIANWNRNQADSKMSMLLETYPNEIEMVIANDDDMALGALDAFEHKGADLPLVVGINGVDEALEMVKMKKMEGTVYNDAKGQAEKIMQLALDLSSPETADAMQATGSSRVIYVDYQLINYKNVQKFIRMKE